MRATRSWPPRKDVMSNPIKPLTATRLNLGDPRSTGGASYKRLPDVLALRGTVKTRPGA